VVTAAATSGTGSAVVPIFLDLDDRIAERFTGDLVVNAPDADDGGATRRSPSRRTATRRTAPESTVATDTDRSKRTPKVASNGLAMARGRRRSSRCDRSASRASGTTGR
jgi:hypothetical protein